MPEKKLDAECAVVGVAPVANFAHDPAAEFVKPLHDVDDVRRDGVLRRVGRG